MVKEYLLSIVGIAFFSVIVHLVLPEGKVSKNVLSAFSLFTLVVMLAPIVKLGREVDFSSVGYSLDEDFLSRVNWSSEQDSISQVLESNFSGAKVQVVANGDISYVFVDLKELVLNENDEHINYYTTIKEIIKDQFEIPDERIVVYG